MTNYNHLDKDKRDKIQYMIEKQFNFTQIASATEIDRTSVSKEVRRNRHLKRPNYSPYNEKGIREAIDGCEQLSKPPYICNNCCNKNYCSKSKLYYNSKIAQERYELVKVETRQGFDIEKTTIEEIEKSIVPLIKDKKHSVNQVYTNFSDVLYFSKTTFYKYIDAGVFSLNNLDLPRKVRYKSRKKKKEDKRRVNSILENRRYTDYLSEVTSFPEKHIVEMDTVIGKINEPKCLLTLIFTDTNFMLIRLINKKSVAGVNEKYEKIKQNLGNELYSKIFEIVLTDNGTEFFDVNMFEMNYENSEKISRVFFCDPYCSWQKPHVEKNHEFIREVIPKETSMEDLTDEDVKKLEDNINNIPRDKFNGATPYELTKKLYPDLIELLNCNYIEPDKVDRSYMFFTK